MTAHHPLVSIFVLAIVPVLAMAQDNWVGKSVVHTKPAPQITFGDRFADKNVTYEFSGIWPFTVREEREGWLRIHDKRNEGWARKEDFVLQSEAVEYFSRRLQTNTQDSFALNMRAGGYQERKEYDKAIADYNTAIGLKANDPVAYNNRGTVWKEKKEYDKAIVDYSEAIRLNPKRTVYYVNRGVVWRLKNEYEKAIADYDKGIELEPRYASAYYHRGICRHQKKDYDGALKDYDESIRLDPKFALAYHERGITWRVKQQYDKAIASFDEAIKLNPKYAYAFRERGLAHKYRKEYEKALSDYRECERLDAKYAMVLSDHAWLLATCPDAKFRDGKNSVMFAKKCCELSNFKVASYVSTLAAAHAEAGDYQEAVNWQKKVLDYPNYVKLYEKSARDRLALYEAGKPYRER